MKKWIVITGSLLLAASVLNTGALAATADNLQTAAVTGSKLAGYELNMVMLTQAPAQTQQQTLKLNPGQAVKLTVKDKAVRWQGRQGEEDVLVPLEFIQKSLKIPVKHDPAAGVYTLTRRHVVVELKPGENGAEAVVNGSKQLLPYEWKVIDGKPYVSVNVVVDHLGVTSNWNQAKDALNLVPHKLNDVKITTERLEKVIPEASIKVEYPQISGLRNKTAETSINALLQERAKSFVERALKETKENQPSPNGSPYEYLGNYTVTFNRGGLLSILEQTYAYTGGAHGISVREGLTFRLSDGKLLTLDEVLRKNPDFRKIVDPSIAKQLKQTEGYFGGFKTIGSNPDYYLKNNGVVIFFQLYDYLPYAYGFPEFYFPFPELYKSN